jgi:hypothetical protein
LVHFHGTLSVDGESLVWVDGNTKEARVGVNQLILVPDNRVPEHTGVIQVGETSHVIAAVKLGRVHLTNLVLFEDLRLKKILLLYSKILRAEVSVR